MVKTNTFFLKLGLVLIIAIMSLTLLNPGRVYALSPVRITEIMYDPSGDGSKEFVEFYNGSDTAANISGWSMFGVDFVFPSGATLAPGAYTVIARNQTALRAAHPGASISGQYGGKLKGSGELIRLSDVSGNIISQVSYSFGGAWPSEPSNGGPSLSLIRVSANETQAGCWASSASSGGSPGSTNSIQGSGGTCSNVAYPVKPPPTAAPSTASTKGNTGTTSPTVQQSTAAKKQEVETKKKEQQAATAQATEAKTAVEAKMEQKDAIVAQQVAKQQKQKWAIVYVSIGITSLGIAGAWLAVRIRRNHQVQLVLEKKVKK